MVSDWVEDPVLKVRLRFERQGETLVGHVEMGPGGGISKHFHPNQEERWKVLEGNMRFTLGRRKQDLNGGEVVVHPGVRHSLKNVGKSVARLRFEAEPALELEPFLLDASAMSRAGGVTKIGIPKNFKAMLDGIILIHRYRETCVLIFPPPFPPPALQGAIFGPLARLVERLPSRRR